MPGSNPEARASFFDDKLRCSVCETQSPSGAIEDCCCAAEHVATANHAHFRPLLRELVQTKFFRYFKVDVSSSCLFWSDNFKCAMRDCAVGECSRDEIPTAWRREDVLEAIEQGKSSAQDLPFACGPPETAPPAAVAGETAAAVTAMSSLDTSHSEVGVDFAGWDAQSEAPWVHQRLPESEMVYVDLVANPERYTGYQGQKIWQAVYEENCFKVAHVNDAYGPQPGASMCLEERVFFRLLSGMHASVNTHIAREFKFPDGHWGPNVDLYVDRVGRHPERLQNLYFTYLFVMRAVVKAREAILARSLETGDQHSDAATRALMQRLLDPDALSACDAVTHGFDESALFRVDRAGLSAIEYAGRVQQKRRLRDAFRRKFQNVTRILDCVGCEKCRVWGKLQVQGLGTAVNLLFAENIESAATLSRNELIALVNMFDRLAQSVDTVREMQDREVAATVTRAGPYIVAGAVVTGLLLAALWRAACPCASRSTQRGKGSKQS